MNVTLNSQLVLFVAKHMHVLQMFPPHTRAVGRFLDVVWVDLGITFAVVRLNTYVYTPTMLWILGYPIEKSYAVP